MKRMASVALGALWVVGAASPAYALKKCVWHEGKRNSSEWILVNTKDVDCGRTRFQDIQVLECDSQKEIDSTSGSLRTHLRHGDIYVTKDPSQLSLCRR